MLEKIFSSKTRVKILTLFSLNPQEKYYVRELTRILNENINSIRRELKNLEDIKLLISEEEGNLKYYRMNEKFPIYEEIKNIFLKTQGVSKVLKKRLSKHDNIDAVFIYGSFASGKANPLSDIDIFVIGEISEETLLKEMNGLEMKFSREINPVLYTKKELAHSIKEKKPFIENVLEEPKLFIINDKSILEGD